MLFKIIFILLITLPITTFCSRSNPTPSESKLQSYYYDLLIRGVREGKANKVKEALDNNANPRIHKHLALHLACEHGDLTIVKMIVESSKGVDLHAEKDLALRLAFQHHHFEVANYLLQKGANADSILDSLLTTSLREKNLTLTKTTMRLYKDDARARNFSLEILKRVELRQSIYNRLADDIEILFYFSGIIDDAEFDQKLIDAVYGVIRNFDDSSYRLFGTLQSNELSSKWLRDTPDQILAVLERRETTFDITEDVLGRIHQSNKSVTYKILEQLPLEKIQKFNFKKFNLNDTQFFLILEKKGINRARIFYIIHRFVGASEMTLRLLFKHNWVDYLNEKTFSILNQYILHNLEESDVNHFVTHILNPSKALAILAQTNRYINYFNAERLRSLLERGAKPSYGGFSAFVAAIDRSNADSLVPIFFEFEADLYETHLGNESAADNLITKMDNPKLWPFISQIDFSRVAPDKITSLSSWKVVEYFRETQDVKNLAITLSFWDGLEKGFSEASDVPLLLKARPYLQDAAAIKRLYLHVKKFREKPTHQAQVTFESTHSLDATEFGDVVTVKTECILPEKKSMWARLWSR